MSSNPVQPYAVLNEVKFKLNISLTDTSQDDQITVATNDSNNYIAEQTAVHAVVVTAGDDPSLSSMANNLAAAYFNFWISTDKSREEIELWQDRIQQYIMAKYGLKSANMLSGDQTFGITGGFGGESSTSGGGSGGGSSGGGEANTASNLGGGEGLFAQKSGVDLQFKSLVAGTNVTLSSDSTTVTINSSGAGSGTLSGLTIDTNKDWLGFNITNMGITSTDTLVITNAGAGLGPAFTSNSADQTMALTGNLDFSSGYADMSEIINGANNPVANAGRLFVADDTGTTTLFFRDSAGTETNLLAGTAGGITSINTDVTAAQTLTGGTGIDIVDNLSGDHSFAIDSTVATSSNNLSFFSPTTSAQLSSIMLDETGTGLLVFGTSPSLITPGIADFTNATHDHESVGGGAQLVASLALVATGTPDATNFLRGDNVWFIPALDNLSDVTINGIAQEQVLVNDGAGQWINQLLTAAQLPSTVAYIDITNTFTQTQQFDGGAQLGVAQVLDMQGSNMIDTAFSRYDEQVSAPPDPALTDATIYLADGSDFNSTDPLFQILIDRGGTIEKKPIVTSETVFALREFSNGMFTEETGVELITDGGIGIRVQQFNEANRANSFEVVLEGQIRTIGSPDTSPGVSNTIDLTVGTDTTPTKHFVWTALVGGIPTMVSSTVDFPMTGDFAIIGTFSLESQATVLADGPYADNAPDNEIFDDSFRGHLAHINDRLLELDAAYLSGIDITVVPTVGGGTDANVIWSSTSGIAFELHKEDIEAFDITATSPDAIALVTNEGTQTSGEVTRVNNIGLDLIGLTCADGVTIIGATQTINVVLCTNHIDSEPNQTNYGVNVPVSPYTGGGRVADAINDINNFAIKNVPLAIRGTALLIAEIVIDITPGPLFEVVAIKDLRGQIPGAASSGGSSGGGGATNLNELTDVTIDSPALDEILQNDGAGQWLNVANPAGLLAGNNIWTGYQDYTAIADPGASLAGVIRFFVETIDANNDALFCHLNQDGIIQKVRIA